MKKIPRMKETMTAESKPTAGFFSFTGCEGCQITLLLMDEITRILDGLDVQSFHLVKEINLMTRFDLAFVEGAITSKKGIETLREIREKSNFLVALGTCACYGGVPAMRNFIQSEALRKYTFQHGRRPDSVTASGIGEFVDVDYYMRGCPIKKREFVDFMEHFTKGEIIRPFEGSVCDQCQRRGVDCLLKQRIECLGAVTHGGCGALCPSENIPCMLCRGPTEKANMAGEIKLFQKFGLSEEDIHNRLNLFKNIE